MRGKSAVPGGARVAVSGGARIPAPGGLPAGADRDDPLPPIPPSGFRPDRGLLRRAPGRLPAVRGPWLREVYDRTRRPR